MSTAFSRAAPAPTEAPGSDPTADDDRLRRLAALRAELDRVDDGLHDLLTQRAELVTQVGALGAKGRVPLRPGREASILRRLLVRNRGALAPATLVRVWRELLAGSSAQQNPMAIVMGDAGLDPVVREHFGALCRPVPAGSGEAIERVRRGDAALAVLRLPTSEDRWQSDLRGDVHIVARLPYWSRPGIVEALVVSAAAPDPSGLDRTVIAGVEPCALSAAGLAGAGALAAGLAEVDGFVTQDDPRLVGLSASVLGAYAVPVGDFA